MRIIFLIIAYIFVFCPKCFAESISDSEIVASSYLIKRNDMAVFSLSGKKPANWTVYILKEIWSSESNQYQMEWHKYLEKSESIFFEVSAKATHFDWKRAMKTIDYETGHTYFDGIVVCEHDNIEDTVYIKFDVLPTRPIILNAALSYDYFDYDWRNFIDPIFEMTVDSKECDVIYLLSSEPYPDIIGEYHFYIQDSPTNVKIDDNTFRLYYDRYTWDLKMFLFATNEFGISAYSDTIYSNDYIEDPQILKFVEDEMNYEMGIHDRYDNQPHNLFVKDGSLCFTGIAKQLSVYRIDGKIMKTVTNTSSINISNLPKGIYTVIAVSNDNRKYSLKVIL